MAVYCFRCPECGAKHQAMVYVDLDETLLGCTECGRGFLVRDYQAEGANFATATLRRENSVPPGGGGILPTPKDYESPSDPDGQKGYRAWKDSVHPAPGNKRAVKL